MPAPESELVRECICLLTEKGIPCWREQSGAAFGLRGRKAEVPGISDIIGIIPHWPSGRMIAIECKIGKNKPTAEQEKFMEVINGAGGLAFPVWSARQLEQRLAVELGILIQPEPVDTED